MSVLVPVTVDQDGTMLDGHHRSRIADRLGVKYDRLVRYCTDDDERREIARTLNADRRHLTGEQRQAVAWDLRQQGHSERAIAGALGVSQMTVHRDINRAEIETPDSIEMPDRVVRQGGGSYPARRPQVPAVQEPPVPRMEMTDPDYWRNTSQRPQVLTRNDREQQRAQLALVQVGETAPAKTLDYILSTNMARRHLNPGQRAMIALEYEKAIAATVKRGRPTSAIETDPDPGPLVKHERSSAARAAKVTGASHTAVSQAKAVQRDAPDLAEQVRAGARVPSDRTDVRDTRRSHD